MKILLAVDGSPCSEAAVMEVARRAWPEGSEVRAISVVEPIVPVIGEAWAGIACAAPDKATLPKSAVVASSSLRMFIPLVDGLISKVKYFLLTYGS